MRLLIKKIPNPFEIFSSGKLVVVGVVCYVASSVFAYYCNFNFQDLISIKQGANSNLWLSFYNNGIPVFLLSVVLYSFALLRKAYARYIDLLGVVLISRIPIYIVLLLLEVFYLHKIQKKIELAVLSDDYLLNTISVFDKIVLVFFGLISLLCLYGFFYYLIKGTTYFIASKRKIDVFWILMMIFGLEFVFLLSGINMY